MTVSRRTIASCLLCFTLLPVLCWSKETALDRYIAKPDTNFSYEHHATESQPLYTTYFLSMTSQSWRSSSEVDRTLWEHDVQIMVPKSLHSLSPETAILDVHGGRNDSPQSIESDEVLGGISVYLGNVLVRVQHIPNQPLAFADEFGRKRKEDGIVAYSFDKFLRTGDEEWPVYLPMTKAVVRTMDTVQQFLKVNKLADIDDFIVTGESKRGWTTWLTAAVDSRIKAIAPLVIDLLQLDEQFIHQFESLGIFSEAIKDHTAFDLPCRIRDEGGDDLLDIVDPYRYRDRMIMPKFIGNATGDDYFLVDSSRFYWDELPGPKHLRYGANADHFESEDVAPTLVSWINTVNNGEKPPAYSWTVTSDGGIEVHAETKPETVKVWQATNPHARDFRDSAIGQAWTSKEIEGVGGRKYMAHVAPPRKGWTAFFVELVYETLYFDGEPQVPVSYTTEVVITPDVLPFSGKACDECRNGLCDPSGRWRFLMPTSKQQ
jgi:PhoPQ-activated pathogenicity-related protein